MIKEKDVKILSLLRKDARVSLTKISTQIKVPISTVYDRVKQHESGLISKYTALMDFNRFGFTTRVHILLAVPKEAREEVKEFLCRHGNINSVFKINNNYDFLVDALFKHIKHLEDFLDVLDQRFKTRRAEVHHIIDELKRESFMDEPETALLVMNQP